MCHILIFIIITALITISLFKGYSYHEELLDFQSQRLEVAKAYADWEETNIQRINLEKECELDPCYMYHHAHSYYPKKAELLEKELGLYYFLLFLDGSKGNPEYLNDLFQKLEAATS